VLPRFLLQAVLGQMDRLLEPAAAKSVLVTSLNERMTRLTNVSPADRAASLAEAERIVRERIVLLFKVEPITKYHGAAERRPRL
jgi:uncharacterized protein (DUF885 family)